MNNRYFLNSVFNRIYCLGKNFLQFSFLATCRTRTNKSAAENAETQLEYQSSTGVSSVEAIGPVEKLTVIIPDFIRTSFSNGNSNTVSVKANDVVLIFYPKNREQNAESGAASLTN